ncbi:unnamed protein product [Ilex paraguariensis]|uniref:Uncharacterized protein n=1 Tax=Ilex paraguariensis TaxID=185542 RepID=A0ABC8RJR5_9AQUA
MVQVFINAGYSKISCSEYYHTVMEWNAPKRRNYDIPLESREVATIFKAYPNASAKDAEKEKSPSPTSKIL